MVSTLRAALDDEASSVICAAALGLQACVTSDEAEQAWHWASMCPRTGVVQDMSYLSAVVLCRIVLRLPAALNKVVPQAPAGICRSEESKLVLPIPTPCMLCCSRQS